MQKAIHNLATGQIEYVPMTADEIADSKRTTEAALTLVALEQAAAAESEMRFSALKKAIADMPGASQIGDAKDIASLRLETLKLHAVMAALLKHMGLVE